MPDCGDTLRHFADPADDSFHHKVPDETLLSKHLFIQRGAVGLAEDEKVWNFAERVQQSRRKE